MNPGNLATCLILLWKGCRNIPHPRGAKKNNEEASAEAALGKGKLKTKLEKLLAVYPLKHGSGIGVKCPWTNIYRLRLP